MTLPQGPDLGRRAQTVALHRDPLGVLVRARARFGPVFTLRMATTGPLVAVAVPGEVERLAASPHAGEARRRILPYAAAQSTFGGDGDAYRAARERAAARFAPEAVARHADAMRALALEHAERWPSGRPFRLLPRLRALAEEVFVRAILGIEDARVRGALVAAVRRMLWTPGNPPLSLPAFEDGLAGRLARREWQRRRAPVARLLESELAARGDALPGATPDELLPLLMAGQEPPAIALAWLLDRLGRDPALAERFRAGGPEADAIVKETLRLRPPALASLRRLDEPAEVHGHRLPAGTIVMLPIPLLHRDPDAFPRPDEFDPGRFSTADPPAFMPFGRGPRRCLGEALAQAEIRAIVPAILSRRRVRPLARAPERMVLRGTALVPRRSLPAVARRA